MTDKRTNELIDVASLYVEKYGVRDTHISGKEDYNFEAPISTTFTLKPYQNPKEQNCFIYPSKLSAVEGAELTPTGKVGLKAFNKELKKAHNACLEDPEGYKNGDISAEKSVFKIHEALAKHLTSINITGGELFLSAPKSGKYLDVENPSLAFEKKMGSCEIDMRISDMRDDVNVRADVTCSFPSGGKGKSR